MAWEGTPFGEAVLGRNLAPKGTPFGGSFCGPTKLCELPRPTREGSPNRPLLALRLRRLSTRFGAPLTQFAHVSCPQPGPKMGAIPHPLLGGRRRPHNFAGPRKASQKGVPLGGKLWLKTASQNGLPSQAMESGFSEDALSKGAQMRVRAAAQTATQRFFGRRP